MTEQVEYSPTPPGQIDNVFNHAYLEWLKQGVTHDGPAPAIAIPPEATMDARVIRKFVEFAKQLFATNTPIGLDSTVDGFALRFQQGETLTVGASQPSNGMTQGSGFSFTSPPRVPNNTGDLSPCHSTGL